MSVYKTVMFIHDALQGQRLVLQNEKVLQAQISEIFKKSGLQFVPEHRLDEKNRVDFLVHDHVAVEVKISGTFQKMAIYRQCERYAKFDYVKSVILITGRSIGFPSDIGGKPCYVINLGKAWL